MKAYIVVGNRGMLDPFNEFPRNCLIGDKTLTSWQKEIFLKLGIEPFSIEDERQVEDRDEHILVGDNVYFSEELLVEFIARSRRQKRNTVCALKKGLFTHRTMSHIQNVTEKEDHINYNLRYLPAEKFREENYSSIVVDLDQSSDHLMVPRHICDSGKYQIPLTRKIIIQIDHWANLWTANILVALSLAAGLKMKSMAKLFLIALRARSFNQWKILSVANRIGKDCDIHPTAYIEGSIIGDGVKIGAGAVIRGSIIGNQSFIGNSVTIETSVVGEKSTILHGHIMFSVFCQSVFSVAQMISASFVGRDSFVGSGVILTDFRLDGNNVIVLKDGVKIDSGSTFLGCCLGNNVYLGSGCVVAPGRTIPCGLHIVLEKGRIIAGGNTEQIIGGFRLIDY